MKKLTKVLVGVIVFAIMNFASATDLLDVFRDAQQTNPTYQQAKATYLGIRATLGTARSKLLPNLGLTGTWGYTHAKTKTDPGYPGYTVETANTTGKLNGTDLTLSLTQNLFNWQAFKAYSQVKLTVKQAAATYAASAQTLIMSTAKAYFAVLQAQDVLRYTAAQKRALYRQLQVAQQRYKVGLDAVTSVYDARAQYDSMKAKYIASENDLANKKEELREVTGQLYPSLAHLKDRFPLIKPDPANVDSWVKTAEEQNLTLLAARYAVQAANQGIKVASASYYPTLALTGSYEDADNKNELNQSPSVAGAKQKIDTTTYGLSLTAPLYQGGKVSAATKKAEYDYQVAVAKMNKAHRLTVANTRKAYLGVVAEISQVEADRQAIKSARAALESNEAGYKVGTQTISNVLLAQSTLYQAETTYAQDRFQYLIHMLTLKQAAGTLNAQDLQQINRWLTTVPIKKTRFVTKKRRKKLNKHSRTETKEANKKVVRHK